MIDSWSLQKAFPDYYFNPALWRISILLFMFWLLLAAFSTGLNFEQHVYFKCSSDSITACDNPFYLMNPCPEASGVLCQRMFFNPGESFGNPPNFFYNTMGFMGALALVIPALLNHYIYNRKGDGS